VRKLARAFSYSPWRYAGPLIIHAAFPPGWNVANTVKSNPTLPPIPPDFFPPDLFDTKLTEREIRLKYFKYPDKPAPKELVLMPGKQFRRMKKLHRRDVIRSNNQDNAKKS
jgi:hypothetical protein